MTEMSGRTLALRICEEKACTISSLLALGATSSVA
jgi:hypothetical protein